MVQKRNAETGWTQDYRGAAGIPAHHHWCHGPTSLGFHNKTRTLKKGAVIKKMNMRCDSTLETWEIIRKIMKIQKKSVTSSLGSATKYLATFSRRSEVSTRYVTCLLGSCTDTHTHTVCLEVTRLGWNWGVVVAAAELFELLLCYWKSTMVFKFKIMFNFIFSIQLYYICVWNDELYIRTRIFLYITCWNVIKYWYLI